MRDGPADADRDADRDADVLVSSRPKTYLSSGRKTYGKRYRRVTAGGGSGRDAQNDGGGGGGGSSSDQAKAQRHSRDLEASKASRRMRTSVVGKRWSDSSSDDDSGQEDSRVKGRGQLVVVEQELGSHVNKNRGQEAVGVEPERKNAHEPRLGKKTSPAKEQVSDQGTEWDEARAVRANNKGSKLRQSSAGTDEVSDHRPSSPSPPKRRRVERERADRDANLSATSSQGSPKPTRPARGSPLRQSVTNGSRLDDATTSVGIDIAQNDSPPKRRRVSPADQASVRSLGGLEAASPEIPAVPQTPEKPAKARDQTPPTPPPQAKPNQPKSPARDLSSVFQRFAVGGGTLNTDRPPIKRPTSTVASMLSRAAERAKSPGKLRGTR